MNKSLEGLETCLQASLHSLLQVNTDPTLFADAIDDNISLLSAMGTAHHPSPTVEADILQKSAMPDIAELLPTDADAVVITGTTPAPVIPPAVSTKLYQHNYIL